MLCCIQTLYAVDILIFVRHPSKDVDLSFDNAAARVATRYGKLWGECPAIGLDGVVINWREFLLLVILTTDHE